MNNLQKKLILIGGFPGSGKTHIGRILAKNVQAVFLDKDTISRFFTEALLGYLGCEPSDRESDLYIEKVRNHEYSTMMKLAMENLEVGNSVICSAPFILEFQSDKWVKDCSFDSSRMNAKLVAIWVHVDEITANERLIHRGAIRDNWKLGNWSAYTEQRPHVIPDFAFDCYLIDNSSDQKEPLNKQVEDFIRNSKLSHV